MPYRLRRRQCAPRLVLHGLEPLALDLLLLLLRALRLLLLQLLRALRLLARGDMRKVAVSAFPAACL